MTLLLSLFILFYQTDDLQTARRSSVDFSAVNQLKVENRGQTPLADRQITFRVRNRSRKALYIHGLKNDSGYSPFGYLIRLDKEERQWVKPEGEASRSPFAAAEGHVPDVYLLRPGRSMTFNQLAEEFYFGSRVKRGIYISFSRDEEPWMVTSEEFVLR